MKSHLGETVPLELSQMWKQQRNSNYYTVYIVIVYSKHCC